ncbi:Tkl protein kinase, partial [Globisporangium splendens]
MFTLCVLLLIYMRVKRHDAFRGDEKAACKIILPAFEPLLWILAVATGTYVAFFSIAMASQMYTTTVPKRDAEIFYAGQQFVFAIVVVFMLQKSVSLPALRRAVVISILLATYTIPVVWILTEYYDPAGLVVFWGQVTSRFFLQLPYLYVLLWPPGRANRTPLRHYCLFVLIYYGFTLAALLMTRLDFSVASAVVGYICLTWASLVPLLIWRVLKADTEFWRGVGQRACSLQNLSEYQTHIEERISSRGLHLLIEMHRKYIIDFAHLEIKKKIGVGASAAVFNGILNSTTDVAVKVYTPRHFTEETIAAFSHEAALCATLNHPNVIKFYGMCICPPTVCLVSELCLGNLEDFMIAAAEREQSPQRQQMLINIGYMIDAARALAYIHSFSPPFLHRDVKPANFLVDMEHNVKLTDFGESRSIPRYKMSEQATPTRRGTQSSSISSMESVSTPNVGLVKMTITGTVDYMPPEMITGRSGIATYGEAADVYSLAITFWDILNPGKDRYPRQQSNFMLIFETVVDGFRPDLDIPGIHPRLRELIANAWQSDPSMRPSTQRIVTTLEAIQEELLASFASELCNDFDQTGVPHGSRLADQEKFITGEYALEKMEEFGYIESSCEGVRLGNALMDAGFLHHIHHAQSFQNNESMYFFDEENVRFCQPFAILEADLTEGSECSGELPDDDETFMTSSRHMTGPKAILSQITSSLTSSGRSQSKASFLSFSGTDTETDKNAKCACRRLGQRLEPQGGRHAHRHRHHRHKQQQQTGQRDRQPLVQSFRRKCPPIVEEDNALDRRLLEDETATPTPLRSRHSNDDQEDQQSGKGHHIGVTIAA